MCFQVGYPVWSRWGGTARVAAWKGHDIEAAEAASLHALRAWARSSRWASGWWALRRRSTLACRRK